MVSSEVSFWVSLFAEAPPQNKKGVGFPVCFTLKTTQGMPRNMTHPFWGVSDVLPEEELWSFFEESGLTSARVSEREAQAEWSYAINVDGTGRDASARVEPGSRTRVDEGL